jgi:hemoglobin/transferrin/lactoferrin receptor protein
MRSWVIGLVTCVWSVSPVVVTAQTPAAESRIRGAVIDESGNPVGAADVELVCGDSRRRVQTTTAGTFVIRDLAPVECRIAASMAGWSTQDVVVQLQPGSGPPPVILTLQTGRFSEQIVVTPSRGLMEWVSRVPESVTVTSREALQRRPYTLLGMALREQPGVLVQQTTTAQVSPVIRGFTGQGNLYLIDGVRLNTSTWRSGPSQYFAWIDGDAVSSLEVVRGSGSLQYGSDGLGGAIQVMPARPPLRAEGSGIVAGGSVEATAASGDRMGGVRLAGTVESSRISLLAGFGATTVGDLHTGGGRDSHAAVTRFLGLPSSLPDGRLPGTGYSMVSSHANVVARVGQSGVLMGTYLGQSQRNVNRYDRLAGGDGLYRSGFTPQRLDLALLKYESVSGGIVDRWSATISMNRQADGRFEQARPTARIDEQDAVTLAWGYQAQATRFWNSRHQVLAGIEVYDESVDATRSLRERSGVVTAARPDVPTGTTYLTSGAFLQQVSEVWRNHLWVKGGLRYSRFTFATAADPALGVIDEQVTADAVTFQAGGVLALSRFLNATLNASRGFRAGNAADLGGIGLTGGGGFEISPGRARGFGALIGSNEGVTATSTGRQVGALQPEVADTFELGLKAHGSRLSASASVFVIEMRNTIQRRTILVDQSIVGTDIDGFTVVRQDDQGRVFVAEDARPVVTRVNLERGRITGLDAEGTVLLPRAVALSAFISVANGRVIGGDFLRRMPPPMGGASLRWSDAKGRRWVEGVVSFARPQTRLNAGDLSDARIGGRRTTASIAAYFNGTAVDLGLVQGGRLVATGETLAQVQSRVLNGAAAASLVTATPGFVSAGLRAGWNLTPDVAVSVIGENLFDRNYRLHGSGVDAPGRSIQMRIRYHLRVPRARIR